MPLHNTLDKVCDKVETSEEPNSYHRVVENLARRFLISLRQSLVIRAEPPLRLSDTVAQSVNSMGARPRFRSGRIQLGHVLVSCEGPLFDNAGKQEIRGAAGGKIKVPAFIQKDVKKWSVICGRFPLMEDLTVQDFLGSARKAN
jgi:hypothetical protein